MNTMTLTTKFALISLNGVETLQKGWIRNLRDKCLVAAQLLELILTGKMQIYNNKYSFRNTNSHDELSKILSQGGRLSITEWMDFIAKLPNKVCAKNRADIVTMLMAEGWLKTLPSLLECDLFYRSSGVDIKEYRTNGSQYSLAIDDLKKDLTHQTISKESLCLIWLLKQSGDLNHIIPMEQQNKLEETLLLVSEKSVFAKNLLDSKIGCNLARCYKKFLLIKNNFAKTPFGRGVVSRFPIIERWESIFIET